MKEAIEKALKTWYPIDHPLRLDPRHPAIKLAGEAGEILDLYGKHEYKPSFDWWTCKKCGYTRDGYHLESGECLAISLQQDFYTPLILDELGDLWYYLRILAYQTNTDLTDKYPSGDKMDKSLAWLNLAASQFHWDFVVENRVNSGRLQVVYHELLNILSLLNTTIDELTELNYIKLNSDPTNHGWKGA